MLKHLINSQSGIYHPLPANHKICSPPQNQGAPGRYTHAELAPTLPFRIAHRTRSHKSSPRVPMWTFRISLCTAPVPSRRAVQGCPHPHHSSFPLSLKIFLSSVCSLCYFPEDCCWIDWALIAWPRQAQDGISPSLHPPILWSCCSSWWFLRNSD